MASPEEVQKSKKSKTSPIQTAFLKNIMFLNIVSKLRNEEYDRKLAEHLAQKKTLHPNLSKSDLKVLSDSFTRNFYDVETKAIAQYQAMHTEREALLSKSDSTALTNEEKKRDATLSHYLSMPPETYVAQSMFDKDTIRTLKANYPKADKELTNKIREIAKKDYVDIHNSSATQLATKDLFNKTFPKLGNELKKMTLSRDGEIKMTAGAAFKLLSTGLKYSNPSSLLVSKSLGLIMNTDSMKALRKNVGQGIQRAAHKTGLTGWVKNKMSKIPADTLKRVGVGLATASTVALVGAGLLELDKVPDIYDTITSTFDEFVNPNLEQYIGHDPVQEVVYGASLNTADIFQDMVVSTSPDMLTPDTVFPTDMVTPTPDAVVPTDTVAPMPDAVAPADAVSPSPDAVAPTETVSPVPDAVLPTDTVSPAPDAVPPTDTVSPVPDAVPSTDGNALSDNFDKEALAPSTDALANAIDSAAQVPSSYTVVSGDTASEIIEEHFKNLGVSYNYELIDSYADMLVSEGRLENKDLIKPGQVIDFIDVVAAEPVLSSQQVAQAMQDTTSVELKGCTPELKEALADDPNPHMDFIQSQVGSPSDNLDIKPSVEFTPDDAYTGATKRYRV